MLEFASCGEVAGCESADWSEPVAGFLSAAKDCRPLVAVRASGDVSGFLLCGRAGLDVSFFAICPVLFAGCCRVAGGCLVAAVASLALEFAAGEAFADCGFVDCSSAAFVSFASACRPVLAVRGAGGSAGFLDCDVAGDAVFVLSDATSLLFGVELEPADFAGEVGTVSPIGCECSLAGDWVGFVFSFAARAPASGLAGVAWFGDVDGV